MRLFLYSLSALAVIALAYWAYNENYATQQALRRVEALQREIGANREKLSVLRAEWAYLNRPERLRDLVDLNYDALRLVPLSALNFADVSQVAYPDPALAAAARNVEKDVTNPVDLSAQTPATDKEAGK